MSPEEGAALGPVHVFIVNYKSSSLLESCLESLALEPVARVHVLDNFSSSSERDAVRRVTGRFSFCTTVFFDNNLGFGAALNRGISEAVLEPNSILWLLNPDTVVHPGAVKELTSTLDYGVDIISPTILTGDLAESRIWFAGGSLDKRRVRTQHFGYGELWDQKSSYHVKRESTFITGAAMMMLGSTWEKLSGFDESFFLYWEDSDLSYRACLLGLKLSVAKDAHIWHAVGGSGDAGGKSAVYYYYMQRNRIWFGKKFSNSTSVVFGSGFKETVALCYRPLRENSHKMTKFTASVRGLVHGLVTNPDSNELRVR